MKRWKSLVLCSVLLAASFDVFACYTVYDRSNRAVYNSESPPIDMSRPLHETLPARFPGGHMVFDTSMACRSIAVMAVVAPARTAAPLLTDERTARAMKAPYRPLSNGAVLVYPEPVTIQ